MRRFLLSVLMAGIVLGVTAPVVLAGQAGTITTNQDCGEFGCFEAPLPGIDEKSIDAFIDGADKKPFSKIVSAIATFMIGLIVALGLIMIVIGGYVYMTAGGSGDRVSMAKTIIGAALLGIILALASYLILNTISGQFFEEPPLPQSNSGGAGSLTQSLGARTPGSRLQGLCNTTAGSCPAGASAEFCATRSRSC